MRRFTSKRRLKPYQLSFFIGILSLIIAAFLPRHGFNYFVNVMPLPTVSLTICPVLGIVGAFSSIYSREWMYLLGNLLLVLAYPLIYLLQFLMTFSI